MSKLKRICSTLMVALIPLLSLGLSHVWTVEAQTAVAEISQESSEEKIHEEIDEDAEYSLEGILVVLDSQTSRLEEVPSGIVDDMLDKGGVFRFGKSYGNR